MSLESLLSGQVVNGKYLLCESLGGGGNGVVFRAEQVLTLLKGRPASISRETDFAVKILSRPEDDPNRFLPELRLATTLNHPHILRGYETGTTTLYKQEFLFLAMEKAERSLHATLEPERGTNRVQRPLSDAETLVLARSLLDALDYTHNQPNPIVHFDLKPSNVLLVRGESGWLTWKLADFGIARVLQGTGAHLTMTSAGSQAYKPPERFGMMDFSAISSAHDMWQLGITLLEALGKIPVGGGERIAVQALMKQNYVPPEDIPSPLREIIEGCLLSDWRERITARNARNLLSPVPTLPETNEPIVVEPSAICEEINPKDGAELIFIPAGEFLMGDDKHKVTLSEYAIYKTPVTVAMYRKFDAEQGFLFDWNRRQPEYGWQDDHPMVCVTWEEACAYCQWAGGDLPTEAHWEKAGRGTDGREFPWGMDWDAGKCNNYSSGPKQTTPVGSYPQGASPYGVLDMAGNVWEWCEDAFEERYRALRGGSWGSGNLNDFRCAYRYRNASGLRLPYFGFRCVMHSK
jgi:formylglycine-generating enzyme required for sulfatase activity